MVRTNFWAGTRLSLSRKCVCVCVCVWKGFYWLKIESSGCLLG